MHTCTHEAISSSFLLQPVDTLSIIGTDARIDCLPPISVPSATVTWSKNFFQLTDLRFQILQNGSLVISTVQLSDQGMYHCTATNPLLGVSRTSVGVNLTALGEDIVHKTFTSSVDVMNWILSHAHTHTHMHSLTTHTHTPSLHTHTHMHTHPPHTHRPPHHHS